MTAGADKRAILPRVHHRRCLILPCICPLGLLSSETCVWQCRWGGCQRPYGHRRRAHGELRRPEAVGEPWNRSCPSRGRQRARWCEQTLGRSLVRSQNVRTTMVFNSGFPKRNAGRCGPRLDVTRRPWRTTPRRHVPRYEGCATGFTYCDDRFSPEGRRRRSYRKAWLLHETEWRLWSGRRNAAQREQSDSQIWAGESTPALKGLECDRASLPQRQGKLGGKCLS